MSQLPREALGPTAPEDDRKAFWINLYNCLVLHATATLGAPADAAQRTQFFTGGSGGAYLICGQRFTLDEIEHGVLRSNALQVGASSPLFGPDDPRLEFVLPALDPRIHFAVSAAAQLGPQACRRVRLARTARAAGSARALGTRRRLPFTCGVARLRSSHARAGTLTQRSAPVWPVAARSLTVGLVRARRSNSTRRNGWRRASHSRLERFSRRTWRPICRRHS